MHWTRSGRHALCGLLAGPPDDACRALLPWVFAGKGAVGTLFKHGGDFPYKLTGSLVHLHGTPLNEALVRFFCNQIQEYSMHPPAVLAPMALLQHTVHEGRLRARISELQALGVIAFYSKMCKLEQDGSLVRCAALDALLAEFEIITTKAARTHLVPLTRSGQATQYVTRWDAAILRLFV